MPAVDDFNSYATVAINAYKSCSYSHPIIMNEQSQREHHVTWASVIVLIVQVYARRIPILGRIRRDITIPWFFAEVYRLDAIAKLYENETICTDYDVNIVC